MRSAALIWLCCGAGTAGAAERTPFQIRCEDTISKTISVLSTTSNGFTINNQLPYRALTLKTGSIDGRTETLGLTVTRAQYAATMGGPILQDKVSGYECVAPPQRSTVTPSSPGGSTASIWPSAALTTT